MQRLVTAHSCLEYCNSMYSECQQNGKTVLVRTCGKLEAPWPLGIPPGQFSCLQAQTAVGQGTPLAQVGSSGCRAGVGAVTPGTGSCPNSLITG